jgi:hypothetical protein
VEDKVEHEPTTAIPITEAVAADAKPVLSVSDVKQRLGLCETCHAPNCNCRSFKRSPKTSLKKVKFEPRDPKAEREVSAGLPAVDETLKKRIATVDVVVQERGASQSSKGSKKQHVYGFNINMKNGTRFIFPAHVMYWDSNNMVGKHDATSIEVSFEFQGSRKRFALDPTKVVYDIQKDIAHVEPVKSLAQFGSPVVADVTTGNSVIMFTPDKMMNGACVERSGSNIVYTVPTEKGVCGSPVLQHNKVVAMHIIGNTTEQAGASVPLRNEGVELAALSNLFQ